MQRTEDKKPLKVEQIQLGEKYVSLFNALSSRNSLIDERVLREIGKSVGFKSSDEKVYKLMSALTEKFLDDMLTSINHKNIEPIKDITKKVDEARDDGKSTPKKLTNLTKTLMNKRVLTLQQVLFQLRENSRIFAKVSVLPRDTFDTD